MANATDDRLRLLIERAERLEEEKQGIADDIKDVFLEAKAVGYCPKTMKQVIKLRKMKPQDRSEQEMLLETYMNALGMEGTPLGNWAATAAKADAEGTGISMSINGGEQIPLNKTAARKMAEAEA